MVQVKRKEYVRVYVYFGKEKIWKERFGHFDLLLEENWEGEDIKEEAKKYYRRTIEDKLFLEQRYESALNFEGQRHFLFEKKLFIYVDEHDLRDYKHDIRPFIREIGKV
ncbi:hypothetical protein GGI25_004897 [Coemansia spiralis]|uniref:Uncharacterized protein n=2 Tax=Coemansia TaxID=4863 RepID=A0A9W8G5Q5_9FUNG|nr:hypothetical protein EDC05_003806 [Coemansia umbellata]KAJ2622612.1 hypothetical protein GGI26_003058 [Coemansia sp. RSA 1358]KAJ2672916.1 hypothetical protein GGI25_004897 [Coemansia spiralis]